MTKFVLYKDDSVVYSWTDDVQTSVPVPQPVPAPAVTPTPTPTPVQAFKPPMFSNSAYQDGTPRAAIGVNGEGWWSFNVPAERKALLVQIIGRNDYTDAQMTWYFPDGRTFPKKEDEGRILGPGSRTVNMQLRSTSAFTPNIPDTYIPTGIHYMKITGTLDGFMTIGF